MQSQVTFSWLNWPQTWKIVSFNIIQRKCTHAHMNSFQKYLRNSNLVSIHTFSNCLLHLTKCENNKSGVTTDFMFHRSAHFSKITKHFLNWYFIFEKLANLTDFGIKNTSIVEKSWWSDFQLISTTYLQNFTFFSLLSVFITASQFLQPIYKKITSGRMLHLLLRGPMNLYKWIILSLL